MTEIDKLYKRLEAIEELREQLREAEERKDENEATRLETKLVSVLSSVPEIISREELRAYHRFLGDELIGSEDSIEALETQLKQANEELDIIKEKVGDYEGYQSKIFCSCL